jgi:hypothetical protein
VATVETNDEGALNLPSELIGSASPHTKFDLAVLGDVVVLRPVEKEQPFWRRATAQQRVEAFRRWADSPSPPAPDISDESLRRENLYD